MAYDSTLLHNPTVAPPAVLSSATQDRREFRRLERFVILTGGGSAGAAAGFGVAIALGKMELWEVLLTATPLMVAALYLVARTLQEGMSRNAIGCTSAAIMHAAALLMWPMTALCAPLSSVSFWIAPLAALATLVLFASCWSGPPRAVYRLGAQAMIVAALTVHQGLLLTLGS
ncbi:hypothetical protein [Terricaulis sp.]|uniref:hypothetical protein n=1 Tax=Terricaulis sp. TaxID=2768686 RepID=UPI003783E86F